MTMSLAEFVSRETGVNLENLMLLRHSSAKVRDLKKWGATVDKYTAIQPIENKYDYHHPTKPHTEIIVVIVKDHVDSVYRVCGIDKEGTNYSLNGPAYRTFQGGQGKDAKPEVAARRYNLESISSRSIGLPITGWEKRQRTTVQRSDSSFFNEIAVDLSLPAETKSLPVETEESVRTKFDEEVRLSRREDSQERRKRLLSASTIPIRQEVWTTIFKRNPDVVAEILERAEGSCESCSKPAPFTRRSDNTPYLEVHHRKPLAAGGQDTVQNAIALCPNCHRQAHYA